MSFFKFKYKINEGIYLSEGNEHKGYGISVFDSSSGKEIIIIEDICESSSEISELIRDCNRLRLSPLHIYEVIEDFLQ